MTSQNKNLRDLHKGYSSPIFSSFLFHSGIHNFKKKHRISLDISGRLRLLVSFFLKTVLCIMNPAFLMYLVCDYFIYLYIYMDMH